MDYNKSLYYLEFYWQMLLRVLLGMAACCARSALASVVKPETDGSASEISRDVMGAKAKFFFGQFSTFSQTVVVLTTSTVPISCINNTVLSSAVCNGRRRKKLLINVNDK